MANVIKPKRSSTSSSVPTTSDLADGEIAVNTADQKIYMRSGSNIVTVADTAAAAAGISNVVEDTTPQLGGDLDTNGNNITFGDNDKAIFGAGTDLEIYHDGTNSYITDGGTGDLKIGGDNVQITTASGTKYFEGSSNIARLYNTGNQKLSTHTSGIVVTGNIILSGTVDGRDVATDGSKLDNIEASATANPNAIDNVVEDTTPQLGGNLDLNSNNITGTGNITTTGDIVLTDTTEDSAAGPEFEFYRNSASPADGDYLGQIKFQGENDADQKVLYAKITGKISDASDTTEDGLIEYAVKKAGTNTIVARLTGTALKLINSTGLEVAGDITVDGTVDGRDVATDGTKLDGIESNATADQTANEILTAIKTVDGASSGLDADLLDGAEGSLYARLASPTFTGTPAAPTASTGTNTTQLATTAFVQQEITALKALLYAYDQS